MRGGLCDSGRLRGIAVSSRERMAAAPELPSLHEAGLTDFEYLGWIVAYAPAGTPKAIVDPLNVALGKVLSDPTIASRLVAMTYDIVYKPSDELTQRMKVERARIGKLYNQFGVKLD